MESRTDADTPGHASKDISHPVQSAFEQRIGGRDTRGAGGGG